MPKNKNPKIVYPQLLNPATGEFKINNDFVVSDKTTIEDLSAHFGEKMAVNYVGKTGHSNYSAWNIQIGELYFSFTFYFFNKIITRVSFVLQAEFYDPGDSNSDNNGDSWDNFSEADEIKKGKFIDKWLADQISIDINTYAWAKQIQIMIFIT